MALQTLRNRPPKVRHRIQEIIIQPTTSERQTKLEVLVDGRDVHKLPSIKPGQSLRWDMQTYPCDIDPGSTIGLKLVEKHYLSPDREVIVEYKISDVTNETSITKDAGAFPSRLSSFGLASKRSSTTSSVKALTIKIKFLDSNQIASSYSDSFDRATKRVEDTQGPLDKLGNAREVLKTILGFGTVVAELHPIAKLVVGLFTKAWEYLEKNQKQHEDLERLLDGLTQMQPFIDSIKDRAKEPALEHVILALLLLIEDTSNYIINSMDQTNAGRVMHGFSDTREPHRINELLQKFGDLKEQFDRGVGVQVLNQVLSIEQRALINRLEPPALSLSMRPPCHEGTRVQAIADICAWHSDEKNPQKLLWVYGQAGMGKSSIASSVCQHFHDAGVLGGHFFFRRDDSYLRSPEHMLNLIVHRLAFQYEPYGRAIASAIEGYSGLLDMPLGQRYVHLVERPLQSLGSASAPPRGTFAIVIDALDECEKTDSRRPLFAHLRKMSQLVSWIKIIVTSRPDEDIEEAFNSTNYSHVASRNVASYDASSDILKYTRTRMAGMTSHKKKSQWTEDSVLELSARADGLFIWVETACKFIEQGVDKKARLEQILAGTQSAEGSAPLDLLYATAIRQGMGDEGPDNMRVFRECIGAIVATGSRTPLSVASLESLLSGHVSPGVFETVVSALGSVLYEDIRQGGAVRVYHPSFADFILDDSRSGCFYTDRDKQNTVLAEYSLRTMTRELRFNICGLETSHILNRNVVNLETRIQTIIRPHLAYSCMHWSSHLTNTPGGTLQDQLGEFLYEVQLLYWIEAMSLLGQTSSALSSLLELVGWASETLKGHSNYAHDAYRFILTFHDAISESTPHLYISALPFTPTNSRLAQRARQLFPNTFMAALNANKGWPSWLQSIPHNAGVISVACSANGRRIVSGCRDGTVQIWDSETGAAISEPLSSPNVCHVAISANGQRLASGSERGELRVWDAGTSAELAHLFENYRYYLLSLSFSFDGSNLFSMSSIGSLLVWDISARVQLSKLLPDHPAGVASAAISYGGQLVAFGYANGSVRIWNTRTSNLHTGPILGHSALVSCVVFSCNDTVVATGSRDATVRVWEVTTGRAFGQTMIGHFDDIVSVAFSSNGRYVVSGSKDRTVRIWDVETGMPACDPMRGHTNPVTSVAFCFNGRRVVSASHDKRVLIWDVGADKTASNPLAGHTDAVNSLAFSSDGRYIASGSEDGTIRVWDAQSGEEAFTRLTGHSGAVRFVTFIPNSRRVLSLASKKMIQIHDMDPSALATSFDLSSSEDIVSIALSPDGQRLASGSQGGRVELWDAGTGVAVSAPVDAHSERVYTVVFSPDGRFFASSSYDGTVQIWDSETGAAAGEPLKSISRMALSISFYPDGRRIAFGGQEGSVQACSTETGVALFEPFQGHDDWVRSIVLTSDGRYIITCSDDTTVRIWDAETGDAVAEAFQGHSGAVYSIALSPDGRRITTGSQDSTVRIWDIGDLRIHDQLVVDELFMAPLKRSVSTSVLAHYANKAGWVTSSNGVLLLWLPKQRQRVDDSLIQISIPPTPNHVLLDFSRFVHGDSWVSVAGGLHLS